MDSIRLNCESPTQQTFRFSMTPPQKKTERCWRNCWSISYWPKGYLNGSRMPPFPYMGQNLIIPSVRLTYIEDSNVIMSETKRASHMRGSEFCRHKHLSPDYRPMGLSRNLGCWRISNGQKQPQLSEFSKGS